MPTHAPPPIPACSETVNTAPERLRMSYAEFLAWSHKNVHAAANIGLSTRVPTASGPTFTGATNRVNTSW